MQTAEHLERFAKSFTLQKDAAKRLGLSDKTLSNYINKRPEPGVKVRDRMREAGYDFKTGQLIIAVEPGKSIEDVSDAIGVKPDADTVTYVIGGVSSLPDIKEAGIEYDNTIQEPVQELQFFRSIDPAAGTFVRHYASPASAGNGKEVFADITQFIDVSKNYHDGTFFVSITGDSLKDLGITEKHRLLVDTTVEPRSGMLVLARKADNFMVKQFKQNGRGWLLCPANANYEPIAVTEEVVIVGVVVEIILRLIG